MLDKILLDKGDKIMHEILEAVLVHKGINKPVFDALTKFLSKLPLSSKKDQKEYRENFLTLFSNLFSNDKEGEQKEQDKLFLLDSVVKLYGNAYVFSLKSKPLNVFLDKVDPEELKKYPAVLNFVDYMRQQQEQQEKQQEREQQEREQREKQEKERLEREQREKEQQEKEKQEQEQREKQEQKLSYSARNPDEYTYVCRLLCMLYTFSNKEMVLDEAKFRIDISIKRDEIGKKTKVDIAPGTYYMHYFFPFLLPDGDYALFKPLETDEKMQKLYVEAEKEAKFLSGISRAKKRDELKLQKSNIANAATSEEILSEQIIIVGSDHCTVSSQTWLIENLPLLKKDRPRYLLCEFLVYGSSSQNDVLLKDRLVLAAVSNGVDETSKIKEKNQKLIATAQENSVILEGVENSLSINVRAEHPEKRLELMDYACSQNIEQILTQNPNAQIVIWVGDRHTEGIVKNLFSNSNITKCVVLHLTGSSDGISAETYTREVIVSASAGQEQLQHEEKEQREREQQEQQQLLQQQQQLQQQQPQQPQGLQQEQPQPQQQEREQPQQQGKHWLITRLFMGAVWGLAFLFTGGYIQRPKKSFIWYYNNGPVTPSARAPNNSSNVGGCSLNSGNNTHDHDNVNKLGTV